MGPALLCSSIWQLTAITLGQTSSIDMRFFRIILAATSYTVAWCRVLPTQRGSPLRGAVHFPRDEESSRTFQLQPLVTDKIDAEKGSLTGWALEIQVGGKALRLLIDSGNDVACVLRQPRSKIHVTDSLPAG